MSLPINGRITIVDDQLNQAEPLIKVLSKQQMPVTYFSGEEEFLPDTENNFNDTRILFLDLNLIDNQEHENKILKSKLVPVLKRVISVDNFPYILIYWSRHEHHQDLIEKDIFENDLSDRKPIGFLSVHKSDFFELTGEESSESKEKVLNLFKTLGNLINQYPAFSYLLNWENQVHSSADKTLQEVFSSYHEYENWTNNANYLFNKLGISFSGKVFNTQNPEEKIKSAYNSLTYLVSDTLEKKINAYVIGDACELEFHEEDAFLPDSIYSINNKLLFSKEEKAIEYPGAIIEFTSPEKSDEKEFKEILSKVFNRAKFEKELKESIEKELKESVEEDLEESIEKEYKKQKKSKSSEKREEIRETWKKVCIIATPPCDYAQKKFNYNRCIKGIFIEAKYIDYIDTRSEAIFISPKFLYEDKVYVLILDFSYFFTVKKGGFNTIDNCELLLTARQQLLGEIQSKLSRHISRQGILFLDD